MWWVLVVVTSASGGGGGDGERVGWGVGVSGVWDLGLRPLLRLLLTIIVVVFGLVRVVVLQFQRRCVWVKFLRYGFCSQLGKDRILVKSWWCLGVFGNEDKDLIFVMDWIKGCFIIIHVMVLCYGNEVSGNFFCLQLPKEEEEGD